jgi:FAD/FMN-containing dehydrogenase
MQWQNAENDADYMARTRAAAESLQPWVGAGLYMNMLSPDEMNRVVEGFGGPQKYARLGRIKAKYDPTNLFRINANIVPVADQ